MRTCISHRTALSYLLRMPNLRRGDNRPSRASVIPKEIPENAAADKNPSSSACSSKCTAFPV